MFRIIILLLTTNAYSYFDLATITSYRSYPSSGAEIAIESGKNIVIYGEGKGSSPIYGLVRPRLRLSTSGVINAYDASVEFFPISFLGFEIGHMKTISNYEDFDFYDCESVGCKGSIQRDYVGQKMALGYKNIVAIGQNYIFRNQYDYDNSNDPVGEFRYFSLANPKEDQSYFSRYALGYKLDKDLLLLVSEYNRFSKSKEVYRLNILAYVMKRQQSVYTFGAGTSKSTFIEEGFSAIFQWRYTFKESQKIF